jgi:DNA-binding NarL/FixJ family response regulator
MNKNPLNPSKCIGVSTQPIRVAVVDDHLMLTQCLSNWVTRQPAFDLAGSAPDGETALQLCAETLPDVVLLDIELPDWDGLNLGQEMLHRMPAIRVVSMSGRTDPYTIWRIHESGLHGFVDKNQDPDLLSKAIFAVAGGETYFSSVFDRVKREWLGRSEAFQKILSEREQNVLQRVAAGSSDLLIAQELEISMSTVEVHRKHIRQKLELHSDRELVAYARLWGLHKN